jgi:hypothetical protein
VTARNDHALPDLDAWLARPAVRVSHHRRSVATPEELWRTAREVRLGDTRLLGRLVRWRIPETSAYATFDELFRGPPFAVLEEGERSLLSGIVGRIWTLRRDYPQLASPAEFRDWNQPGTARVLFANWVEERAPKGSLLRSETRVEPFGVQGRIGVASVRPLIHGFQQLIGSDAMAVAVRRAEAQPWRPAA